MNRVLHKGRLKLIKIIRIQEEIKVRNMPLNYSYKLTQ